MDSWATCARTFEVNGSLAYAAIAWSLAADPEPGIPESPLIVLAALRRAALQGRATDPFTGDIDAARSDLRAVLPEIIADVEVGLVQYTDPLRLGEVLPGMWLAAQWYPGRPLRIVDLGTCAGMLLLAAWVAVRFDTAAWSPPAPLAEVAYPMRVPADLASTPLVFESAVGIDLRPLDARSPEAMTTLRSFVWPGRGRDQRLERGIRTAQQQPPRLVQGDVLDLAPDVIRDRLDKDAVTVVIDSAFSHYLPRSAQRELGRSLDRLCGAAPLVLITQGNAESGDPHRSTRRAIDLTGRRRQVYAETGNLGQSPAWLGSRR